jgi:hypothetical protein
VSVLPVGLGDSVSSARTQGRTVGGSQMLLHSTFILSGWSPFKYRTASFFTMLDLFTFIKYGLLLVRLYYFCFSVLKTMYFMK